MLLLIGERRALLAAVSAFSVGHSLTLVVGYLGWVALGEAWIEVCIALTIAVLAMPLGDTAERRSAVSRDARVRFRVPSAVPGAGGGMVTLQPA